MKILLYSSSICYFFNFFSTFKVADNFISEKIEKEIISILGLNKSLIKFDLKGNRISKACLNKVNSILKRNRK